MFFFRGALNPGVMTMKPKDPRVDTNKIGFNTQLSSGDIQSLNKAYSCAGRVATYGGGNAQVRSIHVHHMNKLHCNTSTNILIVTVEIMHSILFVFIYLLGMSRGAAEY